MASGVGQRTASDSNTQNPQTLDRLDAIAALAVAATLGTVYWWRMLHGMGFVGDSIKFQFIGPTAGVGHETGNPVYLMLVWVMTRVPLGDAGTQVNAVSSLATMITGLLLFVVLRQLSVSRSVAVAFSVALGIAPVVLLYSVVAEVHALHLMLMAAMLLVLVLWMKDRRHRYLYILIALVAVSLGNHSTTALLVPGILIFLWKVDRRAAFTLKTASAAVVGVVVAAASYYYLIWRAADETSFYLELTPRSFGDLVDMWLGGRYRGESMFNVGLDQIVTELFPYALAIFAVSFAVLVPLIAVGYRAMRGSPVRTLLVWWAAASIFFILAIGAIPGWVAPYFMPSMLVLIVLAAVGAEWAIDDRVESKAVRAALLVGVVVLVFAPYPPTLAWTDWSEDTAYQAEVRDWLTDLPQDSVLAVSYRGAMASWYMMSIEHVQTGVEVLHVDGFDLDSDWYDLVDDYLAGAPGHAWQLRRDIEPGKDVFAPTDEWMCLLLNRGFALAPYRPGMYRVVAERDAMPTADRATDDMRSICTEIGWTGLS